MKQSETFEFLKESYVLSQKQAQEHIDRSQRILISMQKECNHSGLVPIYQKGQLSDYETQSLMVQCPNCYLELTQKEVKDLIERSEKEDE